MKTAHMVGGPHHGEKIAIREFTEFISFPVLNEVVSFMEVASFVFPTPIQCGNIEYRKIISSETDAIYCCSDDPVRDIIDFYMGEK